MPTSGAAALDATPTRRRPLLTSALLALLRLAALPLWVVVIGAWAFPLYAAVRLFQPRPPVVFTPARAADVLRRVLGPLPWPGLHPVDRLTVLVALAERFHMAALFGLAWWLDEALFGRRLDRTPITAPLFELSAARSGSTQLAHHLEDAPALVAPSSLRAIFPYLWLWRLAGATLGRWLSPETTQRLFTAPMSESHLQRHEADAFRTDSLDSIFRGFHLMDLLSTLGPDAVDALDPGALTPANRALWEDDFGVYVDRLLRRTLVDGGPHRRAFIKGHFLAAADALTRRYPDAVFVTVVRDPVKRMQSMLNFHREQPGEVVAAVPWTWLLPRTVAQELVYDDAERAWFQRPGGPCRLALRFDDYVADLPGTIARVYHEALNAEPPAALPAEHKRRARQYSTDVTLAQVGADLTAIEARCVAQRAWMATLGVVDHPITRTA